VFGRMLTSPGREFDIGVRVRWLLTTNSCWQVTFGNQAIWNVFPVTKPSQRFTAQLRNPIQTIGCGIALVTPQNVGRIGVVPRQNYIRDEERRDSRPCRREYDQHCFDRAQRFWGTGTRARVPRTYIYIKDGRKVDPD